MPNKEVRAIITENKIQNACTDVSYPQLSGLPDEVIQNQLNELIKDRVLGLIPKEGCDVYQVIKGTYSVELNQKGILSLKFNVYTYRWHAANGLDVQKSITVNLETGRVYQLYDLFKRDSDYRSVLTKLVKEQISERDIPLIEEFKTISDNEDFYLTNDSLVIYFQEIEYTPHYIGIPEFPISYSQIRNLVRPEGPISWFIKGK
ncbi:MAG: Anti-sigma-V factor RsiV [Pelotomaculum sp. PtaB.Bin104]|nr:MAG: Anti-sigma-V factor RsiV [Pelotomaculum sp. PtaB.Bin104]